MLEYIKPDTFSVMASLQRISDTLKQFAVECEKMQQQYDSETGHSVKVAEQNKWNESVQQNLRLFSRWTLEEIFIGKMIAVKEK